MCTITSAVKKYKLIIKKKKTKHDEIVLLAKTKLNSIEVLISKALMDSYISHDEFVLVHCMVLYFILYDILVNYIIFNKIYKRRNEKSKSFIS